MNIPDARSIESTLDPLLEQVRNSFDLPGLAVGIVRGDEIVYARGFGVRDIRTREPVTVRSLFHQASISKLFTATAIVQLSERGKVGLADPVVKYLPKFRLADARSQSITIEQLLTHTSRMPDPEDHDWEHPEYDEGALQRLMCGLHSSQLVAEPGQMFAYSSLGYNVLGALITEVCGEPFETFMMDHILELSGMRDSTFFKPVVPPDLATSPHIRTPHMMVSNIYPYSRPQAPSSTLQSNVLDMCQWALGCLMGEEPGDRVDPHRILAPESYQLLWSARAYTGHDKDERQAEIGLGWFAGKYRGMPVVMHDGGDVGYEAELVLLPEQKVAVAVMANIYPAMTTAITGMLLDVLLGHAVQPPKPPLMLAMLTMLRETSLEAAIAHYRRSDQDSRQADVAFLEDSIFILREARQPEKADELLELGVGLYPDVFIAMEGHV